MLIAEYDYDVDIAVQREEALQEGEAKGFSLGIAQGEAKGFSEGLHQKSLQDAANFKRLGVSIDIIAQATGLTEKEIKQL